MITRRRLVVAVTLGGLAAPIASLAQQYRRIPRIGILLYYPLAARRKSWDAFLGGLRDLGYVEGRNILIEFTSAEGDSKRLPELAVELVRMNVDLIVTSGTEPVQAALKATKTIPIVVTAIGDPVGAGVVTSLSKPGGNVTGFSLQATDLSAKRVELLKEILPRLTRFAVLWNPDNASVALKFEEFVRAAHAKGLQVESLEVRHPGELEAAIEAAAHAMASAIMDTGDTLQVAYQARIVELASRYRLPVMSEYGASVDAGALCGYGPNLNDLFRRAAGLVDKILKGANPGDLPIEQPTKLELAVNLKTAKTLAIPISQSVLVRADRVVE